MVASPKKTKIAEKIIKIISRKIAISLDFNKKLILAKF